METMAAINGLVRDSVDKNSALDANDVRTVLIEPGHRLLAEITPDLAAYAQHKLQDRGVEVRLNAKITGADKHYVEIDHGERIPARTLIWAAGVKPNPAVEHLDCPKGKHGGIQVNACCQVAQHSDIWALGDCAEVPHPGGKTSYAPTAQNATREGALVARNIVAQLRGRQPQPFRYTPMGELALVGKHSGVARVFGQNFSGPVAWAMWRAVYLAKMPGTAQKARIASDWLLDIVFGREPISLQRTSSASAASAASAASK